MDAAHQNADRRHASYQYYAAGKPLGARGDAVGYNPDSYPKPGVPQGKVSEKMDHRQQDL